MRREPICGRDLFPSPTPSPREKALHTIKQAALRLVVIGGRDNFKLVDRLFAALPELREL